LTANAVRQASEPKPGIITFEVDSGASAHFVTTKTGLDGFDPTSSICVEVADQRSMLTSGKGHIANKVQDVHVAPDFGNNLLSVMSLYKDGLATIFHPRHGVLVARAEDLHIKCSEVLCKGRVEDDSFLIDIHTSPNVSASRSTHDPKPVPVTKTSYAAMAAKSKPTTTTIQVRDKAELWVRRLGYPSPSRVVKLVQNRANRIDLPASIAASDIPSKELDAYHEGKDHAHPHRDLGSKKSTSVPFQLVHMDVKVVNIESYGRAKYILVIVCDFTRWKTSLPLIHKYDVIPALERWHQQFVVPLGYKVSRIRCDNGGEQKSRLFDALLTRLGIRAEYTNPYSSASNGVAERAIQTIMTTSRAIRIGANLPKPAWAECARTATFLENRMPTRSNDGAKSPFELLYRRAPDLSILRTVGCRAFVFQHKPDRKALDPTSRRGIMLGYAENSPGYRILMDVRTGEIKETLHVTFVETVTGLPGTIESMPGPDADHSYMTPLAIDAPIPAPAEVDTIEIPKDQIPEDGIEAINPDSHVIIPQELLPHLDVDLRPKRQTRVPSRYADNNQLQRLALHRANAVKIKYSEAVQDPRLKISMLAELCHLFEAGAIKIADLPTGRRPIGVVWTHKFKHDENGKFTRAKSRLCPWGFQQVPGLDYNPDQISAPTLSVEGGMLLLAITVQRGMHSRLIDVDSAFSIAENKQEVYMKFPDGMAAIPGKALLLTHSINGTKQGAYDWHELAHTTLTELGFKSSLIDQCIYSRWRGEMLTLVGLYVDDFRIISDEVASLDSIESEFRRRFSVKVAKDSWWLGMKIEHDRENGKLELSQATTINDLLEKFGMRDCSPQWTPAAPGTKLIKTPDGIEDPEARGFPYREAVGSLLWLARTSRPDILYAVNQLGAHAINPNSSHVTAVRRVLRYLKGTKDLKMTLKKADNIILRAFVDADYAGEPEENDHPMRSLTGMIAYIHGVGPIYSQSSLQSTISRSTAEAEYRATATAGMFCSGFRQLLGELGFPQEAPSIIYNDNAACLIMAKNKSSGSNTRHVRLQYHFIRELVSEGEVKVEYCPTDRMIADIMTKALPKPRFEELRNVLMNNL
jgi:hypothetical protein